MRRVDNFAARRVDNFATMCRLSRNPGSLKPSGALTAGPSLYRDRFALKSGPKGKVRWRRALHEDLHIFITIWLVTLPWFTCIVFDKYIYR